MSEGARILRWCRDRQNDCIKDPRLLERNEFKLGEMFIAESISRLNGGSVLTSPCRCSNATSATVAICSNTPLAFQPRPGAAFRDAGQGQAVAVERDDFGPLTMLARSCRDATCPAHTARVSYAKSIGLLMDYQLTRSTILTRRLPRLPHTSLEAQFDTVVSAPARLTLWAISPLASSSLPLRHLGPIEINLTPPRVAPHDHRHARSSRIVKRHRWAGFGFP
jgi:hypothetical protein